MRYTIDSRMRGKRALQALAYAAPELNELIEHKVNEHDEQTGKEEPTLIRMVLDVVRDSTVSRWCRHAAGASGWRIKPSDASAAAVSLYFKAALEHTSLHKSLQTQLAAILGSTLKPSLHRMALYYRKCDDTSLEWSATPQSRTEVWQNILLPLADLMLKSFAAGRLVIASEDTLHRRLLAWSPERDNLRDVLRTALLHGRQTTDAILQSPFAYYLINAGLASIVPFALSICLQCSRRFIEANRCKCPSCNHALQTAIRPLCLSSVYLESCVRHLEENTIYYSAPETSTSRATAADQSTQELETAQEGAQQ